MLEHRKIVSTYIDKYSLKLSKEDQDLLFTMLTNPEGELSGEFFELYNNREALRLAQDIVDNELESETEYKIKKLLQMPFGKDTKIVLHMQYWTYKCQFANMDDIWHMIKDFPDNEINITENKPHNYYDALQLRDEKMIIRSANLDDEGFLLLVDERHRYTLLRKLFFELIKPIRRTIWEEPFIAITKKWIIEDQLDWLCAELLRSCNVILLKNNKMTIEDLRHYINRIDVYVKRNNTKKIWKETEKWGAKRVSLMLDIIHLKHQLKMQQKVIKKYFNNSNIANMIVSFYERNYKDLWDKTKSIGTMIQQKEMYLWAYMNGKIPLK